MSRRVPVLFVALLSLLAACGERRPEFATDHARALLAEHLRVPQRTIVIYSDVAGRDKDTWLVDYKVDGDPARMQARYRATREAWVLNALRETVTGTTTEWELLEGEPDPAGPAEADPAAVEGGTESRVIAENTASALREVAMAVESYAVDTDAYPVVAGVRDLARMLEPTYVAALATHDEWGEELYWDSDGTTYVVASSGPDREWDTADDLEMADGSMVSP